MKAHVSPKRLRLLNALRIAAFVGAGLLAASVFGYSVEVILGKMFSVTPVASAICSILAVALLTWLFSIRNMTAFSA
jgi:hypothetical protein